ncbi:MAG TPA: BREX-3 system P-loop-containing protein BrxF [Synergistaceae bacterium]|nr:BREX-3 system P-loop-containing protein BrxF [Synergistaceae bacterium]
MGEPLADKIMEKINQAAQGYHRLVLVVAPPGAGKTAALREVQGRTGAPLVNVNLELSRALLDLTEHQRSSRTSRLLAAIVDDSGAEVILLDNTEILFDPSLQQDPLRLLQLLSRNKTVVAAWNGEVQTAPKPGASSAPPPSPSLVYATPDHPEYRRYSAHDLLVVTPEAVA